MKLIKKITIFSLSLAAIALTTLFALPAQKAEAKPPFNVYRGTVTGIYGDCIYIQKCSGGSLTIGKSSSSIHTVYEGNTYEFYMQYGGNCGQEEYVSAYRVSCN